MTSAINPANPVYGNPTTKSVRDNFAIAKQEITDLQAAVAALQLNMPYMPLAGADMTGPLILFREPQSADEAATKAYIDVLHTLINDLEARVAALESAALRRRVGLKQ
jgi:hypothetical protein